MKLERTDSGGRESGSPGETSPRLDHGAAYARALETCRNQPPQLLQSVSIETRPERFRDLRPHSSDTSSGYLDDRPLPALAPLSPGDQRDMR